MADNIGQTESNRGNKQNFERERDTRKGGETGDAGSKEGHETRKGAKYDYPDKEVKGQYPNKEIKGEGRESGGSEPQKDERGFEGKEIDREKNVGGEVTKDREVTGVGLDKEDSDDDIEND